MKRTFVMPKKLETDSNVTIRELYALVDGRISEVNVSIQRLEGKFDGLESGRLSAIERSYAELKAEVSVNKGQKMMVPILVSVAIAVFGFIINIIVIK